MSTMSRAARQHTASLMQEGGFAQATSALERPWEIACRQTSADLTEACTEILLEQSLLSRVVLDYPAALSAIETAIALADGIGLRDRFEMIREETQRVAAIVGDRAPLVDVEELIVRQFDQRDLDRLRSEWRQEELTRPGADLLTPAPAAPGP